MSGRIPGGSNPYQHGYSSYPARPSSSQGNAGYSSLSSYGSQRSSSLSRPGSAMGYGSPHSSGMQSTMATGSSSRPGAGVAYVNGRAVVRTPLTPTGFTSSYASGLSATMAQRSSMRLTSSDKHFVYSNIPAFAAQASRHLGSVANLEPEASNASKIARFEQRSLGYLEPYNPRQKQQLSHALSLYQAEGGDNYLMNVNAMGYQSLHQFLRASYQADISDREMSHFVRRFNDKYVRGLRSSAEFDALKTHMERELRAPTSLLTHLLHAAPPVSGMRVLKGVIGNASFYSTQMDSSKVLQKILNGDALLFNGFLSTTPSVNSAMMFMGHGVLSDLGAPVYVIDLMQENVPTEVLRRMTLDKLRSGELSPDVLLFDITTQHARGISADAAHQCNPHGNRMPTEKEMLFAPGHSFQTHRLTFTKEGCVISGTLSYGR